jgi:hypothetical protein
MGNAKTLGSMRRIGCMRRNNFPISGQNMLIGSAGADFKLWPGHIQFNLSLPAGDAGEGTDVGPEGEWEDRSKVRGALVVTWHPCKGSNP